MLNAIQESRVQSIGAENNVAAWDGSRIKALLALIAQYGPTLLPIILSLFGLQSAEDHKLKAAPDRELTAVDWKAIFALILQLLAMFAPAPSPVPTPTPPQPGPVA